MQKFNLPLLILLFTLGLAVNGCKKSEENPVGPGDSEEQGFVTPNEFGGATPANVLAIVRTKFNSGISMGLAFVEFKNQEDKGKVTVTVGQQQYEFIKNVSNGAATYYYGPSADNPNRGITLGAGIVDAIFSVENYSLTNTTVQVPDEVTLTTPAADSVVSKNGGLVVSWISSGTPIASGILIEDSKGNQVEKFDLAGDASSASFTAAELNGLTSGAASVYAYTYNFVLSNNNDAVLIAESVALADITIE